MKKFIAPLLVGAALTSAFGADESLKQEIEALKAQMAELKSAQAKVNVEALKNQLSEVKAHDAGDNIKWTVDFRTAYDYVDYKIGSGFAPYNAMSPTAIAGKTEKNGLWTNKLILGMASQPADNLVFKGSLGAYKAFGQNDVQNGMFQDFDWYGTQKPNDSTIRLREAYFLYFGEMGDVAYSASFGRRPSVDGFMTNLRADNEHPASPIGHNINMEFDGASFKFDVDKVTGVSGMYFKICLGRGFSETTGSYSMASDMTGFNPAYIKDRENPNMDLAGLIFQAFDNGQYKMMVNAFKGWNMMDIGMDVTMDGSYNITNMAYNGMYDVGDLTGGAISFQVNGIGNGISDFLDDSIFFISYAMSKTDPNNVTVNTLNGSAYMASMYHFGGEGMLGSNKSETGHSVYTGIQVPGVMEGQRLGLEYNKGSKYWRSFTYGEDTLVGSKLAARGDAYEVYYIVPLVKKNLTAQLSYVYIDYDYAGSDLFFGQTGNPSGMMGMMPYVDKASEVRASLRYRY